MLFRSKPFDPNNMKEALKKAKASSKKAIFDLMEHNEMMDEDGYPTDACLDVIKLWHWTDARGWFKFIESNWAYHSFGWTEEIGGVDDFTDLPLKEDTLRYHISTAGWSGNESIIRAMKENDFMWSLNWVQSRRGGHYIFELKEFDDGQE